MEKKIIGKCIKRICAFVKLRLANVFVVLTTFLNKCVSKTHRRQTGGAVKTMRNTPPHFSKATFPSLTVCSYSTQEIESDVSARLPNITSASFDLDL